MHYLIKKRIHHKPLFGSSLTKICIILFGLCLEKDYIIKFLIRDLYNLIKINNLCHLDINIAFDRRYAIHIFQNS